MSEREVSDEELAFHNHYVKPLLKEAQRQAESAKPPTLPSPSKPVEEMTPEEFQAHYQEILRVQAEHRQGNS